MKFSGGNFFENITFELICIDGDARVIKVCMFRTHV